MLERCGNTRRTCIYDGRPPVDRHRRHRRRPLAHLQHLDHRGLRDRRRRWPVAKHGNRADYKQIRQRRRARRAGRPPRPHPGTGRPRIDEVGIGFCYAQNFHPAMRQRSARARPGRRTMSISSARCPTRPAPPTWIGVFSPDLTEPLAGVLGRLGSTAAFVAHGYGSMDELSLAGPNRISALRNGLVTTFELDAAELGFGRASLADLKGGDANDNAVITRRILSGEERGPKRDAVSLNAAMGLALPNGDWKAVSMRHDSLDSGAAEKALDKMIEVSNL